MPRFDTNVFEIFWPILEPHGFRKALAASGNQRVVFVAKGAEEINFYLFVTDGRPNGSDVKVALWIAPLEFPGDGLDRLGVGIKCRIASAFEVDDQFMKAAAKKTAFYFPEFCKLAPFVQKELQTPFIVTDRLAFYRTERALIAALSEAVHKAGGGTEKELNVALQKAVGSGKNAYKQLEVFLSALLQQFCRSGQLRIPESFNEIPETARGGLIAGHLYTQALLR